MTDDAPDKTQAFTIILPEGMNCDEAVKALGERYIAAAGGDPVLAVLLACQDVIVMRGAASHGMMHGRKLTIEQD